MFTNVTRKQFEAAERQHAIEPHRVLCQDEMLESVGAEDLSSRLWDMFPYMMRGVMSLPQLVAPTTNSLLLLYDDAQSIYGRARSKQFSFKSVGVQAHGRTTILKINYRHTKQILQTADLIAADLLTADDRDDDGIPLVKPISCGREGQEPILIKLPTLREEAFAIADQLNQAHKEGHAWGDMAILCPDYSTRDLCAQVLHQRQMPVEMRRSPGDFDPTSDTIKVMTMKVSKGLEFPVVALAGVGYMPAKGGDEQEAARVFYAAATRATQRLVIGVGGDAGFGRMLSVEPGIRADHITHKH